MLRGHLCWFTNGALDRPDSLQNLAPFLDDLVEHLDSEVAGLNGLVRPVAQEAMRELRGLVENYNAAPYDPLGRLADAVAATAAEYHRNFGANVPDDLWQSTTPRFSFSSRRPSLSFEGTINVQLWTEFSGQDHPNPEVMMNISPRWLDQPTIAALPRSLLHEYIAHVPQGPHSERRVHPDPSDPFAEGWMDYIAHRVFKDVLARRRPQNALCDTLIPQWTLIYDAAADNFFHARCSLRDGDRTAAARQLGAAAASDLHDLLRRLPDTRGDADGYLYRLSFGLNASALDNLARKTFAANVQNCLKLGSRLDALVVPLRDWINGRITSEQFFELVIGR